MGLTIDRRQWRYADSLAAIGELTARWLEGDLAYQPEDFATEPAPETRPLVPVLAAFNRAGFVTMNSQPGVVLRAGSGQRAFVTGYCGELSLRRLERAVADTHLVLLTYKPGDAEGDPVAVTMRDGVETTRLGRPVSADYIRRTWDQDVAPAGVAALLAASQFQLFDPEWGRKALLWQRLRELYASSPGGPQAVRERGGAES